MATLNRKDARNSLVTEMEAITEVQEVFDHLTKNLRGQSPVICVESYSADPAKFAEYSENIFQFAVWIFVKRTDGSTAEDLLDDISKLAVEKVLNWNTGEFFAESQTDYEVLDEEQYKYETLFVEVDWQGV